MSVEELLDVQVTSVSRKAQRLARAPAAVYVITQEELRRSGVTSVAEALRLVPGMQVGKLNGGSWAISARGGADYLANKMLVMVDGRSVYNNLIGGTFWQHLDLLMEDIDRIEVIRGPGGVMWGANAVNGVVNVITRSARHTVGNLLSVSAGSQEHAQVSIRHGGKMRSGAYRVWAKTSERTLFGGATATYRQDFSRLPLLASREIVDLPSGGHGATLHGGFRLDFNHRDRDQFLVSGDMYGGSWRNYWAGLQATPPFGVVGSMDDRLAGGNLLARWTRSGDTGGETSAQLYVDRFQSHFPYMHNSTVLNIDVQQTRPLNESNELMWSFNFRQSRAGMMRSLDAQSTRPIRFDSLFSGVLQDDIELSPNRWYLSVGARLEHNNFTGFEFQPSTRLMYTPTKRDSYWAAWSRAVRTPTMAEHNIDYKGYAGFAGLPLVYGAVPNESFRSEKLYAHEGGYRHENKTWSASAAAFYNRYTGIKAFLPARASVQFTPFPHVYLPTMVHNARNETVYGAEFWSVWSPSPKWKLLPSYSWLRRNAHELQHLNTVERILVTGEDPAHQFRFRSLLDLSSTWQLDTAFYYTSSIVRQAIPAHPRLDLRLSWRPTRKQEWSAGVFDATEAQALEGGPVGPFLASELRRMWQLKWVYRF